MHGRVSHALTNRAFIDLIPISEIEHAAFAAWTTTRAQTATMVLICCPLADRWWRVRVHALVRPHLGAMSLRERAPTDAWRAHSGSMCTHTRSLLRESRPLQTVRAKWRASLHDEQTAHAGPLADRATP